MSIGKYTFEDCLKVSLSCKDFSEFRKTQRNLYQACWRNGWIPKLKYKPTVFTKTNDFIVKDLGFYLADDNKFYELIKKLTTRFIFIDQNENIFIFNLNGTISAPIDKKINLVKYIGLQLPVTYEYTKDKSKLNIRSDISGNYTLEVQLTDYIDFSRRNKWKISIEGLADD